MSEENVKFELNIIPKFLDSALTPVAKEAGERLADIVSLVFTPVIKAKAKRDKNIELFLKELDNEINNIPENELQYPPLNIVGPTLDNVFKFYHDEEHLRKMYSILIASSMNSNKNVHPSYIEIIRQFSSYDAAIFNAHFKPCFLKNLRLRADKIVFFAFDYCGIYNNICNANISYSLFYPKEDKLCFVDFSTIFSLQSLIRLGLIYSITQKTSIKLLEKYNITLEKTVDSTLEILQITTTPTNFGKEFACTCCTDEINKNCFIRGDERFLKKLVVRRNSMSLQ